MRTASGDAPRLKPAVDVSRVVSDVPADLDVGGASPEVSPLSECPLGDVAEPAGQLLRGDEVHVDEYDSRSPFSDELRRNGERRSVMA